MGRKKFILCQKDFDNVEVLDDESEGFLMNVTAKKTGTKVNDRKGSFIIFTYI